MTIYNVGDKIPLDDIIPGDHIRFECKYTRTQTDTVHLIVDTVGMRSRVFCDGRNESINRHPDSVTDAYLVSISPEREKLQAREKAELDAQRAKHDKAFAAFEALPKGATFTYEYNSTATVVWTKIRSRLWNEVESDHGEVYLTEMTPEEVFYKVYDEASGNCYGLLGAKDAKGSLIEEPVSTSDFVL